MIDLCQTSLVAALWEYDKYVLAQRLLEMDEDEIKDKVRVWAPEYYEMLDGQMTSKMVEGEDVLNVGDFYTFCNRMSRDETEKKYLFCNLERSKNLD